MRVRVCVRVRVCTTIYKLVNRACEVGGKRECIGNLTHGIITARNVRARARALWVQYFFVTLYFHPLTHLVKTTHARTTHTLQGRQQSTQHAQPDDVAHGCEH